MDVAEGLGDFASDPMISRPANEESDLAAHQPGIDHLVLAGLLPLKQGSQKALDGEDPPTTSPIGAPTFMGGRPSAPL